MVEGQIRLPAGPVPKFVGAWRSYVADRSVNPWHLVESRVLLAVGGAEIILLHVFGHLAGIVLLLALAWYSVLRFQIGLVGPMLLMSALLVMVLVNREYSNYVTTLSVFIQLMVFGTLIKRVRQIKAEGALASIALGEKAPALLLRAFSDDETDTAEARASMIFGYQTNHSTVEEVLTRILSPLGPVVAIGRPGEALPPLGAARFYVANDRWQDAVHDLIAESHSIVMMMGRISASSENSGLAWEVEKIISEDALNRLVLVMPICGSEEAKDRWDSYARLIPGGLPPYQGDEIAVAFSEGKTHIARLVRSVLRRPLWGDRVTLFRISEIRGAFCVKTGADVNVPTSAPSCQGAEAQIQARGN